MDITLRLLSRPHSESRLQWVGEGAGEMVQWVMHGLLCDHEVWRSDPSSHVTSQAFSTLASVGDRDGDHWGLVASSLAKKI